MLSVASISSASASAEYFAKDDYYTGGEPGEHSEWAGRGAEALGLSGEVSKEAFEKILNGQLPTGEQVGTPGNRQLGMDMTFSMPKSASLLAYIGGDKRILDAHRQAVREAMKWAEKNHAEGRDYSDNPKGNAVGTGKLVYALFEHETSRALDPQGHIHAVVANMTQMPDGSWKALHNGELWKNNTAIGAVYHAQFAAKLGELGYQTKAQGKYGQFEIEGVERKAIDHFSQRAQEIAKEAEAKGLKASDHKALDKATLSTRDAKQNIKDRDALYAGWQERAREIGFAPAALIEAARRQVASGFGVAARLEAVKGAIAQAMAPRDALTDGPIARLKMGAGEFAAQGATASAIRHLAEREAAFRPTDVVKEALSLGWQGVTSAMVEKRMTQLVEKGELIPGVSTRSDHRLEYLTTREELKREERIIAAIETGKDAKNPVVAPEDIARRLSAENAVQLTEGQKAGATIALATGDRIVAVQGVAGSGKSTMLQTVNRIAGEEGKRVIGLAVQNKMVGDLRDGAGLDARTISSFVHEYLPAALKGEGKESLKDTILVVDEASMVGNKQTEDLITITERLGADKLVLVGDRMQLAAIDAGKSFSLIQKSGARIARMDEALRQLTPQLKVVAALANRGRARAALNALGKSVMESKAPNAGALKHWLALEPKERDRTALFASGRQARDSLNIEAQKGLREEGVLKGEGKELSVLDQVNTTNEQLRNPQHYTTGRVLDVMSRTAKAGLPRGEHRIIGHDAKGNPILQDSRGRTRVFEPAKMSPDKKSAGFSLNEEKQIKLHENERIRWRANETARDLHNSSLAKVTGVDDKGITVELANRESVTLKPGDPMLRRMDLAYALNMHMAQGMTADKGIAVMQSNERFLSSKQLFNVTVSRVRDGLTLFTDDKAKLGSQIEATPGTKTSAAEITGKVAIDPQGAGKPSSPSARDEGVKQAEKADAPIESAADKGGVKGAGKPSPELNIEKTL